MAGKSGDRSVHFPAIEKKHGKPVAFWLKELKGLGEAKYADQISFLRERHGFSQAHANALVMYARGSASSRRHDTPDALMSSIGGDRERLMRAILGAITKKHRSLELVVAWNQPMLKHGKDYVFGISAAAGHLLMAPFGAIPEAMDEARAKGLETNKKTIKVPLDWKVDSALLDRIVRARLAEIDGK